MSLRSWFSWALALAIALGSTAVVVKTAAFPEQSWPSLVSSTAHRIQQALALEWMRAAAAWPAPRRGDPPELGYPSTADGAQGVRYTIRAALDPDRRRIEGEETVERRGNPSEPWYFYLYPQGPSGIRILSVSRDGQLLPFEIRNGGLWIDPPKGGAERVTVRFVTDVSTSSPRYGFRDPVWILSYWYPLLAVKQDGQWLPQPAPKGFGDPYLTDPADYEVTWTAPRGMTWFASAPAAGTVESPAATVTTVMKGRNLRHFALVGSSSYRESAIELPGGPRLRLGLLDEEHREALQSTAVAALQTYRERFGKLPFPEVSLVETPPGTTFAQELPNLALIEVNLWSGGMSREEAEHWTAHELAHLWWYNAVGDYEALTPWLDEGLADYSAYLYEEARYGSEHYRSEMNRLTAWFRERRSYSPGHPGDRLPPAPLGATARPYEDFDTEWQYYYLSYLRPVLMYHDLRRAMGDDRFFRWLQSFYDGNLGRTATAEAWWAALRKEAPDQEARARTWLNAPNDDLLGHIDEEGRLRPDGN